LEIHPILAKEELKFGEDTLHCSEAKKRLISSLQVKQDQIVTFGQCLPNVKCSWYFMYLNGR